MAVDLPIRCACGVVQGRARGVSGERGHRLVCHCDDCQTFAHFLGRTEGVLDAHGGTDIFQMSPVHLEISEGMDRVACVRLRPNGLLRWYASCCKTPLGNTVASRQVPFVGLILRAVDVASTGKSLDQLIGPVRARIQGRFATGDRAHLQAHDKAPVSAIVRSAGLLLGARLRGEHAMSPLFDAKTGTPVVTPHVLSVEELQRAQSARASA